LTEAAVVRGIVLGDRPLIPEELEDACQRSGVTHVLAISGQHVAILAAAVFFGLRLVAVPPHARAGVTVLLTRLYIVVAGRHPPPSGPGWSPRSCWRQSSSGARSRPCDSQSYNGLKVRFSATVGEEPEVEVALG
jgi:hypothetical protein